MRFLGTIWGKPLKALFKACSVVCVPSRCKFGSACVLCAFARLYARAFGVFLEPSVHGLMHANPSRRLPQRHRGPTVRRGTQLSSTLSTLSRQGVPRCYIRNPQTML